MALWIAVPTQLIEEVTDLFAHVFVTWYFPLKRGVGHPLGVHIHERKLALCVVELTKDAIEQRRHPRPISDILQDERSRASPL